ncbi:MAG: hypothetical protein RIR26_1502 [Pseudomonadota bacterium]
MDITEDKVSMIRYDFLAPDCPAGQEAVNNRSTAQYMTGDSVTLPALATNTTGPSQPDPASTVSIEAKKFDYISQKEYLTPVSESGVNFLSSLVTTGKSWVVNEEQDVTDTLYQLVTGQSSGKAPERMYSIFSLNGDTLCLGTSGQTIDDGTTEAKRHTKLDAGTKCFKRKL